MRIVLQSPSRSLISFSADELIGISNSLNEVCHGVHIEDFEFETRLGVPRKFLQEILSKIQAGGETQTLQPDIRAEVWADQGSVQAIFVAVHGDPVDMSVEEAICFRNKLEHVINEANC